MQRRRAAPACGTGTGSGGVLGSAVTGARVRAAWMCGGGARGRSGIFCLKNHSCPLTPLKPARRRRRMQPKQQVLHTTAAPAAAAAAFGHSRYCSPPLHSAPPGHRPPRRPCRVHL
jgi:hypothetical protein